MKAAIYCRVSTDNQEKEGTSLDTQLEACLKYCQEKSYQVSHQFKETFSGLTLDRPKLNELLKLVKTGEIEVIVVYCLDRLTRNPNHGVILTEDFDRNHVVLEAVTETVESSDLGRFINYVRGFASKLEAEKIKERTMRGKLAYLKNGKLPQGTGIGIYGYKWNKSTGRREIIEGEAKVVQKIFNMAIEGISTNQIAIKLNGEGIKTKDGHLWHPLTVRRILRNQTYTGNTYWGQTKRVSKTKVESQPKENWILLPNVTPPIINEDVFNLAQEAMKKAKELRPVKPNSNFPLTGFMRCSKCGSTIGGRTLSGKYRYYQCRGADRTATREKICDARLIKAEEVESFVFERLNELFSHCESTIFDLLDRGYHSKPDFSPNLDEQIKKLKIEFKKYPLREQNLYSLLSHDSVTKDFVLDEVNALKRRKSEDENQLKRLLETRDKSTRNIIPITNYSDFIKDWHQVMPVPSDPLQLRNFMKRYRVNILALPGNYKLNCSLNMTPGDTSHKQDGITDSTFLEAVIELEQKHPELSFMDWIDHAVPIPEDTALGKTISQIKKANLASNKNFVTIVRTSA